ncbi:MAG: ferrous iron transport protein A [Myxococcota bacterium]
MGLHDRTCSSLDRVSPGDRVRICAHAEAQPTPRRLRDLGFVPGTPIRVVRRAPLGDPLELELRGYRLCVRRADAERVCTRPLADGAPTDSLA